jgi:hypothetical protein
MTWSVNLLVGLILFLVTIGVFWMTIKPASSKVVEDSPTEKKEEVCKTDDDCTANPGGNKCLIIYPGNFVPFCGCLTDDDCTGGYCGSDNKCL